MRSSAPASRGKALVFASVAVASTFWLLLEVALRRGGVRRHRTRTRAAARPVTDLPRIHERYLIYLVPFFFVALFAALGLRRPKIPGAGTSSVAAVVSAALPALIPFGTVVNRHERHRLVRPASCSARRSPGTPSRSRTRPSLIVALSALLAVVYLLAATRRLPPAAAVLVTAAALLGMSTLELGTQVTPIARTRRPSRSRRLGRPGRRRPRRTSASWAAPESASAALRETAFWNQSIARVYYACRMAFGADFGEQTWPPVPSARAMPSCRRRADVSGARARARSGGQARARRPCERHPADLAGLLPALRLRRRRARAGASRAARAGTR